MKKTKKILCFLLAAVLTLCIMPSSLLSASAAGGSWAGSWGTPAIESGIVLGYDSLLSQNGFHIRDYVPPNSTLRTVITPTLGGSKIRLKFSNVFGTEPLTIDETTVAKTGKTDDVVNGDTITQVTFNGGSKSVTIAPGSEVYSDEISFTTKALEKISITTYYKKSTPFYTAGLYGGVSYLCIGLGNKTHSDNVTAVATKLSFTSGSITYNTIPFLTRVDVYAPGAYSVVIAGDSTVTNDSYLLLAQKLINSGITNVGVVMSGIIGNALLHDGDSAGLLGKVYGQSMIKRFQRDVLSVAGVKYIILKVGDNDVTHPMCQSMKDKVEYASPSDIIAGYRNLINQVNNTGKGITMYICTRTPFKGYTRNFLGENDLVWTQEAENMLLEVNSWVKGVSDDYCGGAINLDAMRDPDDSTKLRSQMTTDGIHFSTLGQIAFVDLIPEKCYGVNRDLKNISAIKGVNPYAAPAETTTAPQSDTNSSGGSGNSSDTGNSSGSTDSSNGSQTGSGQTSSTQPSGETTTMNAGVIVSPETTTNNANQIFLNNEDQGNNEGAGTVTDSTDKTVAQQVAGFAVLAAVAVALIAVASVMLLKMQQGGQRSTRSSYSLMRKKSKGV